MPTSTAASGGVLSRAAVTPGGPTRAGAAGGAWMEHFFGGAGAGRFGGALEGFGAGAGFFGRGTGAARLPGLTGNIMRGLRRGGLPGAFSRVGTYLGFGFEAMGPKAGMLESVMRQKDFFKTVAGGREMFRKVMSPARSMGLVGGGKVLAEPIGAAIGRGGSMASLGEAQTFMKGMKTAFGRRRWMAAGVGAAALVGASQVGFGNIATIGMGYAAGALGGAALRSTVGFGGAATRMARARGGARWGGRFGAFVAGAGVLTGIL